MSLAPVPVSLESAMPEMADRVQFITPEIKKRLTPESGQECFRPARLRDAYRRNRVRQRLLLARRLLEAGVRFVT